MHFVQFVTVHRTRSQDARSRIDPSFSYVLPRSRSFSPKRERERERSRDRGMDFISRLNATRGKKKKKSASILGGLDWRWTARCSFSPFFFSFFFFSIYLSMCVWRICMNHGHECSRAAIDKVRIKLYSLCLSFFFYLRR